MTALPVLIRKAIPPLQPVAPHQVGLPPSAVQERLRRPWRQAALLLALLPALQACSGSPFGEELSNSFSTPAPASRPDPATRRPAATADRANADNRPPAAGTTTPPAETTRPAAPAGNRPSGTATNPPATSSGQAPAAPRPAAGTTRTAPYRVTILLPQADAAAPAEVVTQALRSAGVPFEVETIERLNRSSSPDTPTSRPAPDPR